MIHDLDHLASLQRGPERYDYPTHDAYLLAWRTWRAIQRDNRPTQAEADISLAVRIDWVNAASARAARDGPHWTRWWSTSMRPGER